ncbi:Retinol dehydrogenase 14 [Lachnellula cervina]|uniref:Retinol dehydrogenase 14 n=1 Tax=Lachnellula cervina TaxID=1316786 RepID=A0A7D8UNW0_9HELO|nr:Retinol dehydrogenase 14 [Lachnellula cervina]
MASSIGPTKLGGTPSQAPICLGLMPQQPGMIGLAEDWTGLTNPAERRKLQNRRNQREYRKRKAIETKSRRGATKSVPQETQDCIVDDSVDLTDLEVYSKTDSRSQLWRAFRAAASPSKLDCTQPGYVAKVCRLTNLQTQQLVSEFKQWAQRSLTMGSPMNDHLQLEAFVKLNVFRALISNSRDLGFTPEETMDDESLSPFVDPSNALCRSRSLPSALRPTKLQSKIPHHPWIDLFPIPAMRDNLLRAEDEYDDMELCGDLVGFFSGSIDRTAMVVWGDPWEPKAWEVTEFFLSHWAWTIKGCPELLESTNYWRKQRGEKPLNFERISFPNAYSIFITPPVPSSNMATKYEQIHESPQGPGDARPTAFQIIKDENLEGKLEGKVILITGCSSGLGIETAQALATTGATLYLTARDLEKAKKALGNLIASPRVHLLELDLDSLASVRACASEFLSKSSRLNIFIANAGIMACPEGRTKDGFESQFGTNHLAHFLLFNLLKPTLLASSTPDFNSRAVILTSIAHRWGSVVFDNLNLDGIYDPSVAYSQSKTANLWTANEIDRRYGGKGLHAWAVNPGGISTNLGQHLPQEAVDGMMKNEELMKAWKSPQQGAATTVWAAVAKALEGQGGKYLEDCHIGKPVNDADGPWGLGYSKWAYDAGAEAKLWKKSSELVGLKEDA